MARVWVGTGEPAGPHSTTWGWIFETAAALPRLSGERAMVKLAGLCLASIHRVSHVSPPV